MGWQEFYHGMEDKYYSLLDWLDKHGLPVYGVIDKIEAQNIPSFPIAVLATLLVIGGLWALVLPAVFGSGTTLTVLVQDETQTPLVGIPIQLSGNGLSGEALQKRLTDNSGRVTFTGLPIGALVTISGDHEEYAIEDQSIVLDQGENTRTLNALAIAVTKSLSLQLYQTNTSQTFDQAIPLLFSCSGGGFEQTSTVTSGQITLNLPAECTSLSVQSLDPTLTLQNTIIDIEGTTSSLYINAPSAGNAVLRVTVYNDSGNEVPGLTLILKSKFGDQLAQKFTDSSGFAEFTGLAPDTYTVFVASDGTYGELDSGPIEVDDVQPIEKSLTVQLASVGEVRLQFVDEGSLAPVAQAKVVLSRGTQIIGTKTTNEGGQVTFSVSSPNSLTVSVDHPTYLIKSGLPVSVSTAGYTQIALTKATLQNSQIVTVKVIDELNQPVENAYVALKKSPSGASVGTNKITGASGTVQFTSLEEGTYFATAYKPGFSDQIKSDLFTVKARENVESTIKLVIGTGTVSFVVSGFDAQPLAGATIQAVDGVTHANVGNEVATNVDGSAELTLRADRYVYFVVNEPNHDPFVTLPLQMKKGITQNVSVEMVNDIPILEIIPLETLVNGNPILEDSGLSPGQTYTVRFALMVPPNTDYDETGVHIRTGSSTEGQTNPIENDGWHIRAVRGAYSKLQKGTTYTSPTGLGIDSQHLTSADAKWANVVFTPGREGLTIVEVDVTVKDSTVQGTDLPLYYRAWGRTGSYVRFPVDAVLGGSESVSQKQGLYANTNLKLYSTGVGTHACTKDFCLGLVGEDIGNGLQTSLLDDYEVDISSKHKLLFTFTSVSESVFADTSLILSSSSGSATLGNYEATNAVGAKKTGVVSGNKVEIPLGTVQKNNVVFGFVNMDASKEGTGKVSFSLVSNKKEVYARELLIRVNAAGVMDVEVVPKAILPLLTNQMIVHVTQTLGSDDIPLENASAEIKLNGTLLTSGFTDIEGGFAFELNEPNANDDVEILVEKQGFKPVTLTLNVGADIVAFLPAQLHETLIVNGTTKKTKDIHMLNLASIPLTIKEVSLTGDFDDLVKFELVNEEILGELLGVNQDQNLIVALSLTEKGQNLLNAKTLKGGVLVKLESGTSGKTFTNELPLTLKVGFGGEVDVEDCLLVDPLNWDVYADPQETKQQSFEIKNTCTVGGVPVKLTQLSAKIKQLSGDALGVFTLVSSDKTTELSSAFKSILNEVPAGGEVVVTASFSPHQIKSGLATPQLIFQATNLTNNGVPDLVEETVKVNLVVNALSKCIVINTPNLLEIDSCPVNTGAGQMGNYFNQVYRPTGVPYYNPSFSTLNNTTNPSGSSLLPSSVSGGYSPYGSYQFGNGTFSPQYGASGYDGFGGYSQGGAQFSPQGGYSSMQGPFANPLYDNYNYTSGAGAFFACGSTEIRIENSCQSEIEIELDADPNVQVSKTGFVLKPNQNERVRVGSGYRIGKYPVFVNARSKGSTDASMEISVIDVLIKSPTEVNHDCIQLDKTKFRFNELIQKPVKGKVINKCYNSGVRLVPSADTVTIASFFSADNEVTLTEKGSTKSQPNSMVHDIQLIGVQTRGEGRDSIQELEFQIFPDFETYKKVNNPFDNPQAGVGQQILDLKYFLEGQYYRVESYGTISVKYLDPYGGGQQKPFPVIFENFFRAAGVLDIGDGNPAITNFQQCINNDALQYQTVNTQTGEKTSYVFDDGHFNKGTQYVFTTKTPYEVLIADDEHCGGRDFLSNVQPVRLTSAENPNVTAEFKVVGTRNIQVTINRPQTLQTDATIKGRLTLKLTRTAFNISTQDVYVDVSFKVSKPGTLTSIAKFKPLACTINGYEKNEGFRGKYGFDLLSWNWTYEGSPSCSEDFCDATQLSIWLNKKIKKFNEFLGQNTNVFTAGKTYTTKNMVLDVVKVIGPIKDDAQSTASTPKNYSFIEAGSGLLNVPSIGNYQQLKEGVEINFNDLQIKLNDATLNEGTQKEYVNLVASKLDTIATLLQPSAGSTQLGELVLVLNPQRLTAAQQTAVKAQGADEFEIAGQKKYLWTFHEYKLFHERMLPFALSSTAQTVEVIIDDKTGNDMVVSTELLKGIYSSIENVDVALILPQASGLTAELTQYILSNAKTKPGFKLDVYGNSMENLTNEFLYFDGLLLADRINTSLLTDLDAVNETNYEYHTNFNSLQTNADEWVVMKALKFKQNYSDTATTAVRTINEAGRYPIGIEATWDSGSAGLKEATVTIQQTGRIIPTGKARANLDDLEAENKQGDAELAYSENPFFRMPFNGRTGLDNGREGYGTSVGMRIDGQLVSVTGTSNSPYVVTNFSEHTSLQDIAAFTTEQGLPTLLDMIGGTSTSVIELAPSIPVGMKAQVFNPSGIGTLQYGIVKLGAETNYLDTPSPVLWYDCTKSTTQPVSVLAQQTCSDGKQNQMSIRSTVAGNENFYTGLALVPDETYAFAPVCGIEQAAIQTSEQTVSIEGVQEGIDAIRFNSVSINSAPNTLQEVIDTVLRGDACGKIENGTFKVIWDASSEKVIPKALQCGTPINPNN